MTSRIIYYYLLLLSPRMLNEINKDYYDSVRKSILDYVLKDEEERKRIGIMQIIH